MHPYTKRIARTAAIAGLLLAGCVNTPDAVLSVTDPDIINPEDVQSAAGANAVRLGALARLNASTSGLESVFLLGGLMVDEWRSGDTFVDRDQIDRRVVIRENAFATTANRTLHRARLTAAQALDLIRTYNAAAPGWHLAEMYFVQGFVENQIAETYCNGVPLSRLVNGVEQYGTPITTAALYDLALAHVDSGIALVTGTTTDDVRVLASLRATRGRILMNQNQFANAATAVAAVPTAHRQFMFHSLTTNQNQLWALNNSARRYNVSAGEGTVGIDFVTPADPRVPSCLGGTAPCTAAGVSASGTRTFDQNTTPPFRAQLIWTTNAASVALVSGVEARLLEAEAQLRGGNPATALATLNALRAPTGTGSGGVAGLAPLTLQATTAAQQDQLFRERAFWLYGRGFRLGDMRRLMRQYTRAENTVFPNGAHHKGGVYGNDVTFPIPQAEDNNPNVTNGGCIDRLP